MKAIKKLKEARFMFRKKKAEEASVEELEDALEKAVSKLSPKEEEEFEEEEEEEEGKETNKSEEPDFEHLSKSLIEGVDEETVEAFPLIKSLVTSLENQIVDLTKGIIYLSDRVEEVEEKLSDNQTLNHKQAKLVSSISKSVREIGDAPLPRKSYLGKNLEIIRKSEGVETKVEISKAESLSRLTALHKAGKIDLAEVTTLEGRIQKDQPIPEKFQELILGSDK